MSCESNLFCNIKFYFCTMNQIKAKNYHINFEGKGFDELDKIIKQNSYSSIFILVDSITVKECLPLFKKKLPQDTIYKTIEIQEGEENKNLNSCEKVWYFLSNHGGDRRSLLINLGGGVVTDMGGFIASTFKRGIDFINIPTTLLSMVDASVGGKTGINFGKSKNQIGVINDPKVVIIEPLFLNTLPLRELKSGFSEMLKHGLIYDKKYWSDISLQLNENKIPRINEIYNSINIKNEIVIDDPYEKNNRKILNFGHTIGHAIESFFLESKIYDYLTHGESIAIGMIIEAHISSNLCKLKISEAKLIKEVFLSIFKKIKISSEDRKQIISLLKYDKKNSHGETNFVLLNSIGFPVIDIKAPVSNIEEGFDFYLS